jgi:SPP1 gp7 family putative phage head morphogenesis protein
MYWFERDLQSQQKVSDKSIKDINKQLLKYYGSTAKKVIADFEATYHKITDAMVEGKEATPADLYKLDKYWQAQAQMRQELKKLGDKQISLLTEAFERDWFDVYYSFTPIVDTVAYNTIDKAAVIQMINAVWCADGKSWSQRVWDNTERLAETLNEGLIHIVASGKPVKELRNVLMERFNVSFNRADTLVRTEVAHIQTQAAAQRYQDYGLEKYEILGNHDDSCGQNGIDCHKMNGKVFYYNQMVIGKNAPPFHPNCRCSILPVVE